MEANVPGVKRVVKIQAEASVRHFYRVEVGDGTLVAMVYPEPNKEEIERIVRLTDVYLKHGILAPEIERVVNERILLLRDLGDVSLQRFFRESNVSQKREKLKEVCRILVTLKKIPVFNTSFVLGHKRMKKEMDFFIEHFVRNFVAERFDIESLRMGLYRLVERIEGISVFAHRDFHSRNMQVCGDRIYLVDFQDSMKAAPYYDLASFAFDAYQDLGRDRDWFFTEFRKMDTFIEWEPFKLTALQRAVKALGTFGFQVVERKHLAYKKYIPRTIRYIKANTYAYMFLPLEIFDGIL